jgi:hypothetical protein
VLLTVSVLSKSVNLDFSPGSQKAAAVEQGKLRNTGNLTLYGAVNCTAEGVFAISCTTYKVCIETALGSLLEAKARLRVTELHYRY